MGTKRYLKMTTASNKDVTEMFEAVCEKIIDMPVEKVKKDILDFKDVRDDVTILDLIDLFNYYDIEFSFELKACWLDSRVDDSEQVIRDKTAAEIHREIGDEEKSQITNPELRETLGKKRELPKFNVQEKSIDPSKIPDFGK